MGGKIVEFFGYRPTDNSPEALAAANQSWCQFINETCTKTIKDESGKSVIAGSCAIQQSSNTAPHVICCPHRLYAEDYKMISDLARIAFGDDFPMCSGRSAIDKVLSTGSPALAVFGHRWGGELRLPQKDNQRSYFVDWIIAKVIPESNNGVVLDDFFAIEVQTIDTTGNYRNSLASLRRDRSEEWSTVGFNWENVNKRILPQLIYKGSILAREDKCQSGLFFVVPRPVYDRVMSRLGGEDNLREVGRLQPSSVTVVAYDYDESQEVVDGKPHPLAINRQRMSSVYELRDTFNNAQLPEANVYSHSVNSALGLG